MIDELNTWPTPYLALCVVCLVLAVLVIVWMLTSSE